MEEARNGMVLVSGQLERGRHGATRLEQAILRMRGGLPLDAEEELLINRGSYLEGKAVIGILEAMAFDRLVEPLPTHLQPALRLQPVVRAQFGQSSRPSNYDLVDSLAARVDGNSPA